MGAFGLPVKGGDMVQHIQSNLSLFFDIAQLVTILYALYKFTRKPHDSLSERVTVLETEVKNLKADISSEKEKRMTLEKAVKMALHSILALIEFEMQYCISEHKEMSDGLKKAKEDLHEFLSEI